MTDNLNINLSEKLIKSLNKNLLSAVSIISENAEKFGTKAYIVGGAIRDLLLDKPLFDLDFVIEGDAVKFSQFLEEKKLCKISQIAGDFGTAKIIIETSGLKIDLASTRTESYPRAGHLPVVDKIGCPLKDDILRRDFTVNSLAVSINPKNFGMLIDYTDGMSDLKNKQLKILHDKSFIDDPTRIIRGLRFSHKLGFQLDPKTKLLQNQYLESFNAEDICYERIKQVINLAFSLNSADLYNEFMNQNIYKLLTKSPKLKDGNSIYTAICRNLNHIETQNTWLIYLACAINLQDAQKLNLNAKETTILSDLDKLLAQNDSFKTNFEIYKFFHSASNEAIIAFSAFKQNKAADKYLNELKDIKLDLDGTKLKKLGFAEGKIIGYTLNQILEQKINGIIKSEDDEKALAINILEGNNLI